MFTLPPIVQTWRDRAAARARYSDLSGALDDLINDLYVLDDHDERAATLDRAAKVTAELAALHTAAWGWDGDATGRPMQVSLDAQAVLLRHVAATERAVIGTFNWPTYAGAELADHRLDDPDGDRLDELWAWTELAYLPWPASRAACLRSLHELIVRHVGERAAVILTVLAEIEEHRALNGNTSPAAPTPPHWYRWSRVLIAAAFAVVGAVMVVPGMDTVTRLAVLAGVPVATYAALFVIVRVLVRRETGQ